MIGSLTKRWSTGLSVVLLSGCGNSGPVGSPPVDSASIATDCAACHPAITESFARHGMANSLGPVRGLTAADITDERSGRRFVLTPETTAGTSGTLELVTPGGGRRIQTVVGRIGAGIKDTSLITVEMDGLTNRPTGHLFFAPLEFMTEKGWELAPFAMFNPHHDPALPLTKECLSCHTDTPLSSLPGSTSEAVFPRHLFGAEAFDHLQPLTCATCHGDPSSHLDALQGGLDPSHPSAAMEPLGRASTLQLRNLCARCHLEGEAHIKLEGPSDRDAPDSSPLWGRRPVLVSAQPDDDFRFVSQVDRLALSECFTQSPDMTCITCHDPHLSVADQGPASFDTRCMVCHPGKDACNRSPALSVLDVTGRASITPSGCVDCHLRRSQPYDLAHVQTVDHWVRRHIPLPATTTPRPFHDLEGPLALFDDGSLSQALDTTKGQQWSRGVIAMGEVKRNRPEKAGEILQTFPSPGSPSVHTPGAPPPLAPLEKSTVFHFQRARILAALGETERAQLAYGDALHLDPTHPESRLNRGELRLLSGDLRGALEDAAAVLMDHPKSEKAWNLRARAASLAGDTRAAVHALLQSAALWPSDPAVWHQAGKRLLALDEWEAAVETLALAHRLDPLLPGLAEDLAVAKAKTEDR